MLLHLRNGNTRTIPVLSAVSGHDVVGVTLYYDDLRKLIDMPAKVSQEYLTTLYLRYGPDQPEEQS